MPKSRAKRKLRKRVERPDGRGNVNNELGLSVCLRLYVSLPLPLSSCLLACLPIDSTGPATKRDEG